MKTLSNAAANTATFFKDLYIVVRFVNCFLSVRVLKPYLGIETPAYKNWWKRRSRRIQRELDNGRI